MFNYLKINILNKKYQVYFNNYLSLKSPISQIDIRIFVKISEYESSYWW